MFASGHLASSAEGEHATLDLGVISSSPTMGIELALKKRKKKLFYWEAEESDGNVMIYDANNSTLGRGPGWRTMASPGLCCKGYLPCKGSGAPWKLALLVCLFLQVP